MTLVLSDLLQCLVECSEKAAKIAQVFRDQNDLFDLLVQEKSEEESNKRFCQDFKTLADVLVQETIKKDVGAKFPDLVAQIRGEEQNSFKNAKDESIEVVLTDSVENTTELLFKVLDGRQTTAETIANIVHSTDIVCEKQCFSTSTYPISELGIWIDPIDSTAEFIEGKYEEHEDETQLYGLKCVCVLIGAYDLTTFTPVLGVLNQPFYSRNSEQKWTSHYYWGMNNNKEVHTSSNIPVEKIKAATSTENFPSGTIVISSSEKPELQEIMKRKYKLIHAAGAGYKTLLVAIQRADLYILSKSSTHFWDTCGPHAILCALGGGMLRLKEVANSGRGSDLQSLQETEIKYTPSTVAFQNHDGILAYRDTQTLQTFLSYLRSTGYVVS